MIGSGGVNSVFIRNNFPEFGSDLVTALSSLDVNDFSHEGRFVLLKFEIISLDLKRSTYNIFNRI